MPTEVAQRETDAATEPGSGLAGPGLLPASPPRLVAIAARRGAAGPVEPVGSANGDEQGYRRFMLSRVRPATRDIGRGYLGKEVHQANDGQTRPALPLAASRNRSDICQEEGIRI
jgi:hypothetical protein